MYRHIVFDLDGTLLDTLDGLLLISNYLCRTHGWPEYDRARLSPLIGGSLGQLIERLVPPGPDAAALRQAAEQEFSSLYSNRDPKSVRPFSGLTALAQRLYNAGVSTAVLTNTEDSAARKLIRTHYADLIPFIAGARSGIPPKPDPTLLCSLLDSMGADRSAALFVGDTRVDVLTAHGAGLPCCGVSWGYGTMAELTQAGADFIVDSPKALERLIFSGAAHI